MAIRFRLLFILLAIGLLFNGCSSDASKIDGMVETISVKAKGYAEEGHVEMVDYYLFVMNGLGLEKKLILASPEERSQKDLDAIHETIHRSDYENTLMKDLSATQYQELQRLRKEYKYLKD